MNIINYLITVLKSSGVVTVFTNDPNVEIRIRPCVPITADGHINHEYAEENLRAEAEDTTVNHSRGRFPNWNQADFTQDQIRHHIKIIFES
jgi:hypothetical protein